MKTTSTSLEVLILLFLTLIPWPAPPIFKISCARDNAKIVRKVVQTKWLPILSKYQVELPLECPFHPARDIFGPQHAATHQHRPSQWTCGFCGKSFYEEKYLEKHFNTRHRSQINTAEDAVCFADYCDIMRCQVLLSQDSTFASSAKMPMTDIELWRESSAYTKAIAPSGPRDVARVFLSPARKKGDKELNQVETDNCPKSIEGKEEDTDDKTEDVDGESNTTSELCDKDLVDSELPPVDQKTQRFIELQKLKANCDPAALQKLKIRCELLVRDCIGSLFLHLTLQEFKEVEEEMNHAVCWYLSCDRYWADTIHSVRPFPWPLLIAITTILTLAICMCYYIIWIVFERHNRTVLHYNKTAIMLKDDTQNRGKQRLLVRDAMNGQSQVSKHTSSGSFLHSSIDEKRKRQGIGYMNSEDSHYSVESGSASLTGQSTPAHLSAEDAYIYVTYPPDLKRKLLESCYNRTTRL